MRSKDKRLSLKYTKRAEILASPSNGWGKVIDDLTIHQVPADHQSIMNREHLEPIIAMIEEDMAERLLHYRERKTSSPGSRH